MSSWDFDRLQLDVADLIEQIRYHQRTNQGSTQTLTRHTHSLKSLALQTGNTLAAELIHQIEGELLDNLTPSTPSSMDELLNRLYSSFLSVEEHKNSEGKSQINSKVEHEKLDHRPITTYQISAKDFISYLNEEQWSLALHKTAKHLTCYALVFEMAKHVEEDLVTVRLDQILQKYTQLGAIFFQKCISNRFLIGLLTESLHSLPQRVPQVQLIEAKILSHRDLLQAKVMVENNFTESSYQKSDLLSEIYEFVRLESSRQNKQAHCSIFGALTYSPHIIDTVKGVIFQAIRNSITHGILSPHERTNLGKKPIGLIEITFFKSQEKYVISIEDDGEGFDYSEQKNLSASAQSLPEPQDSYSGRNLGLGMMQWYTERLLGGVFVLESKPSFGTKITLELCSSLIVHDGISLLAKNTGCFIKQENVFGLIDSIESIHPSRLGSYWYGTIYGKNYPLFELNLEHDSNQMNQQNKFDLKTLGMYTPEVQKGKGILFRYKQELVILVAVDMIAKERIVEKMSNGDMFSQAFEKAVFLLE